MGLRHVVSWAWYALNVCLFISSKVEQGRAYLPSRSLFPPEAAGASYARARP